MKIYKAILFLTLSLSLFKNSIAMEPDSEDEESYYTDTESVSGKKSKKDYNVKLGFEYFLELPAELQLMILYFDLSSLTTGRAIRRRVQNLSLVCTLIKDSLKCFKREKIWAKLLAAEEYVKENSATIVNELFLSAENNNIENIRFLILGNADLINTDYGSTVLTYTAFHGNTEIIKTFIAAGVDLDIKDIQGETALICAAKKGHIETIKIIIAAGVNFDIKDNQGRTALIWATLNDHTKIIKKLIAAHVDLDIKDNNGETALISAADGGYTKIVKILINAGANLNIKTNNGNTVLILAAYEGYIKLVKILIAAGADLNIRNNYGHTARIAAAKNSRIEIEKLLKSAKSRRKIHRCNLN